MSAIEFVVRNSAGALNRGFIGGDGGAVPILAEAGSDISLRLERTQILSYSRNGTALEITLVDGQVVVIENFFAPDGTQVSDLHISTNGLLTEVELAEGPGGSYFSTYIDDDTIGKWGPDEALTFLDGPAIQLAGVVDEPAGMLDTGFLTGIPILPAALLGAAALIPGASDGGTDEGDGGDGGTVLPEVETRPDPEGTIRAGTVETGTIVTAEDHADGVDISGTGTVGATVTVTVGDATQETVIDEDGNWTVTFPPEEIPTGTYETPVEVVISDDGREIELEETLSVDTEAFVDFDEDAVGGDGTVNAGEAAGTVTLTGTVEAGSSVVVTIEGVDYTATVEGETWTVSLPADTLDGGEYVQGVTVSATDSVGNTATTMGDFTVDTVTNVAVATATIGGNGVVNAQEHASGFTVTGTAEAGATVVVTLEGATLEAVADANGAWSVYVTSDDVPAGTYEATVTAVATDLAGNTATASGTIRIDTEMSVTVDTASVEGDGRVSGAEASDGVTITGTAEAGAAVTVVMGSITHTTTANAQGNWSVTYAANEIAQGTYTATVQVSATDAAGNTATTSGTLQVDTATRVTFDAGAVGGDGVVNAAEADSVTLTGTNEAGAAVVVTIAGVDYEATVTGGTWSLTLPAADVPEGEYIQNVTVTATDGFGNTASTTGTYRVDTETAVTVNTATVEGDGVVNKAERADGVTLTGTAEAGASVAVTMAGVTQTVTASANGTWSANFPASAVPTGETTAAVSVTSTDRAGNTATATGTVEIDTVTEVSVDTSGIEGDGIVNAAERSDGIVLTGTAEAGASVQVQMAGAVRTVTAGADGTWSATFAAGDVPQGETNAPVTVTATDAAGNTATATDTVRIDTFVNALDVTSGPVGGDGIVNFNEAGQAITVTGIVEPGSTVTVTMAGVQVAATVAANGNWTVTFPAGSIPGGEYDTQMVVSATDAAGNTAQLSQDVRVDTVAGDLTLSPDPIEGDDIVNAVEHADGVTIHGTATPGLTVTVTLGDATQQVVANPDGTWSTDFPGASIPVGTYDTPITATITDDAGNTKSVSDQVRIDTELPFTLNKPVEGDNVINQAESRDGVVLSGTVEPGSTVVVTFAGATRTVTAGANGTWSITYPASDIPQGESMQTVTATATDIAGNTADISHQVRVDTIVNTLTVNGPVEGDDLVNRAEAGDGITLTGRVEVGSTVLVTFEGVTRAATVDAAGNWTVDFAASEIPGGEYTATVTIDATDRYGNTRSITDTFEVDTTPPEAPIIESYTRGSSGVRGLSTSLSDDTITISQISGNGTVTELDPVVFENEAFNELQFNFTAPVPNGSHLVMNASDESGNSTATLFVLEETNNDVVNVTNPGLDGFDIEAIDLQFAEDSELTLTAADLEALCAHSNTLTIHGGADDTVNIAGATANGQTSQIGSNTYVHYDLGNNGGTVIIDESIMVNTMP